MKVVLYGASGMIGSRILHELLSRKHKVTAVVRDTSKLKVDGADVRQGDVLDPKSVVETATGADAAISAYAPPANAPQIIVAAVESLLQGLRDAGVRRFIMVGGAGTLEVSPGVQLLSTPELPAPWKPLASAHGEALDLLKTTPDLDWTSFSPAAFIGPGVRRGTFRLGMDRLVTDDRGESQISAEDYAVALVDELEEPKHVRQRFTVAY